MEAPVPDGGGRAVDRAGARLCRLSEIPDPGGKGFAPPDRPRFFVVRAGGLLRGYVNSCPHQGVNLDWRPDTFLTVERDLIQCATHGARFIIDTGECVAGPCIGRSLTPVAVDVAGDWVVLA